VNLPKHGIRQQMDPSEVKNRRRTDADIKAIAQKTNLEKDD